MTFEEQERSMAIPALLINAKLNALKLTLNDKQLEIYNNHILEELSKIEPLLKTILSPEQYDITVKAFLS